MQASRKEYEALARETGFIQRSTSRLSGSAFFNLLTVEALDERTISYEGLCDILEERNPNTQITPQALCERMNSDGAVAFLEAGLERSLKETTRQQSAAMAMAWLEPFLRVLLQDSTQLQIHEKMADAFKGSGGNACAACVKVDYSYDVKSEKAEHIAIRQGADSDQGFAEDLAARVQKDDLVIRDLGYFCLNFFAYLTSIGAYFLSRLSFNVNVYQTADAEEPVKLIQHINRFGNGGKTMEFNMFLGQKQRIPIRLIVYRLPSDVYRKRQKAAIKASKRKGRGISRLSYLKFLKYTFFITNVPAALWPMEAVGTVYRLRWQVEDYKRGDNPESIAEILANKLHWTFQAEKIGDLVTKPSDTGLVFQLILDNQSFRYSFDKNASRLFDRLENEVAPRTGNSIFLPAKEVLSLHHIILKSRQQDQVFGFDDTYLDLARALQILPERGFLPASTYDLAGGCLPPKGHGSYDFEQSCDLLEGMIGGRIEYDETANRWYFKKGGQRFSIGTTAEGVKKVAILDRLLNNRYLSENSIIFIDEPESALHPEAISKLLDIVAILAKHGIQFFLASHSYFVIKKLFLIAQEQKISIPVLSKEGDSWQQSDLLDGMPDNAIINESIRLYEEEVELAFK